MVELGLAPGVTVMEVGEDGLGFSAGRGRLELKELPPEVRAALLRLPSSEEALAGIEQVSALASQGCLQYLLTESGRVLAELRPQARPLPFPLPPLAPGARYQLSRFAFLRTVEGRWVVDCPSGLGMLEIGDSAVLETLHALRVPCAPSSSEGLFRLLLAMEALVEEGAEDRDDDLVSWQFHDLLFHARSRFGRQVTTFGGGYSLQQRLDPLPAARPVDPTLRQVPLPRPDLTRLALEDPPFSRVLEERVSVRRFGPTAMTLEQLGEFLYRTARIRKQWDVAAPNPDGSPGKSYTLSSRPYPSGGACYAIEIYPMVHRCQGIEPGVYFYDPQEHRLAMLQPAGPAMDAILGWAGANRPDVWLTMSARFQRISWKYDSLAYSLILKDVGVLMQNMYLVATAMGLGGCAMGAGNPDDFCAATGNRYLAESSVGEFMLGTVP